MIWEVECEKDRYIEDNDSNSEDDEISYNKIEE